MRRDAIVGAPGSACAPNPADRGAVLARMGGRRPGILLPTRVLTALLALGVIGLVGLIDDDPGPDTAPTRLLAGEPGLCTIGFALSPDGRTVATARNDGRLAIRDIRDECGIARIVDRQRGPAPGLDFSPDGRFLALGRNEPGILLVDWPAPHFLVQ